MLNKGKENPPPFPPYRENGTDNSGSIRNLLIAILSTIALADFGLGLNTVVLPLYAKSLGASIITIGLIIACFGLARIFVNIPVSIISKRFKSHYIHIGMLFIFAGAVGYLFSTAYYQLFFFRFLEGFGSGIINTSSMIILTKRLYKHEKRAKVLSMYMIARRLSMGSAPFLGAIIAYEFSDKASFAVYSVIMAAGLIIAFNNKIFLNRLNNESVAGEAADGGVEEAGGAGGNGETGKIFAANAGDEEPEVTLISGAPQTRLE